MHGTWGGARMEPTGVLPYLGWRDILETHLWSHLGCGAGAGGAAQSSGTLGSLLSHRDMGGAATAALTNTQLVAIVENTVLSSFTLCLNDFSWVKLTRAYLASM